MNTYYVERCILHEVESAHVKDLILTILKLKNKFDRFSKVVPHYPECGTPGITVGRKFIQLPTVDFETYVAIIEDGVLSNKKSLNTRLNLLDDELRGCLDYTDLYSEHDRKCIGILLDYTYGNYYSWAEGNVEEADKMCLADLKELRK